MSHLRRIVLFCVVLVLCAGSALGQVYHVTAYGAKGDGITENAASIQKAIDAAAAAGGGVVLFPAGQYRTTTIFLKEDVDCWRWRRFESIQVTRGDEIKLVAEADQKERVRLDFVEFIPTGR